MRLDSEYDLSEYPTATLDAVEADIYVSANGGRTKTGLTRVDDVTDAGTLSQRIREQLTAADSQFDGTELHAIDVTLSYGRNKVKLHISPEREDEHLVFDGTVTQQLSDRMVEETADLILGAARTISGKAS